MSWDFMQAIFLDDKTYKKLVALQEKYDVSSPKEVIKKLLKETRSEDDEYLDTVEL